MKTIVIFIGGYLPGKKYGGPVTSLENFTNQLHDNYDIRIICSDHDFKENDRYKGITDGWNQVGFATLQLQKGSKLIFNGRAAIARGAVINNAGVIEFGNNFSSNFGLFISCSKRIAFGNSCLLGWNNHFLDNNGHVIFDSIGNITSVPKEINIGNNVWITSETHFLSGSAIGDGCVVGYKSFVLRDFSNIEKCLIAGSPSKVLRENIMWKK